MKSSKILKITAVILLILVMAGGWIYFEFFRIDPQLEDQLQQQFGKEFFNPETLPSNPAAINEQDLDQASPIVRAALEKLESMEQKDSNDISRQTQEEIVKRYLPRFEALEGNATSRLDALFSSGIQEYRQQKGQGTLNKSRLAGKYIKAAGMLEKNVDASFYNTLEEMKSELQQNNLSTDIIKTISQEYDNAKLSKKKQLIGRVKI